MPWHKLVTRVVKPTLLRTIPPAAKIPVQTAVTGATGNPLIGKFAGELASATLKVIIQVAL